MRISLILGVVIAICFSTLSHSVEPSNSVDDFLLQREDSARKELNAMLENMATDKGPISAVEDAAALIETKPIDETPPAVEKTAESITPLIEEPPPPPPVVVVKPIAKPAAIATKPPVKIAKKVEAKTTTVAKKPAIPPTLKAGEIALPPRYQKKVAIAQVVEPPPPVEVQKPVVLAEPVEPTPPLEVQKPVVLAESVESPPPTEVQKPVVLAETVEPTPPLEVQKPVVLAEPVEPTPPLEVHEDSARKEPNNTLANMATDKGPINDIDNATALVETKPADETPPQEEAPPPPPVVVVKPIIKPATITTKAPVKIAKKTETKTTTVAKKPAIPPTLKAGEIALPPRYQKKVAVAQVVEPPPAAIQEPVVAIESAAIIDVQVIAPPPPVHDSSEDVSRHLNLALVYFYEAKYWLTVEECNAALQIEPNNAMAWTRRGSGYYMLEQYAQAKKDWRLALKLSTKKADRLDLERFLNKLEKQIEQ